MTFVDGRLLHALGWRDFFAQQLGAGSEPELEPARIVAVHRDRVEVIGAAYRGGIQLSGTSSRLSVTVGDWVLIDRSGPTVRSCLECLSLFQRRAAGTGAARQPIAANVATVFIVTSANREFNVARLERYLAIANGAAVHPVVVLTKADTVGSVAEFVQAAARPAPGLHFEALDVRSAADTEVLRRWCPVGQTVALLGSSGVGKSTLIKTLTDTSIATQAVRGADQRGRHTTTGRSMRPLPDGGWLIDSPGMRELQLVDLEHGIDDVFVEITALSVRCRFSGCAHDTEPDCAVRTAVESGRLNACRLRWFHKLRVLQYSSVGQKPLAKHAGLTQGDGLSRSEVTNAGSVWESLVVDREEMNSNAGSA